MNIKEIITEEVVDEYQTIGKHSPMDSIKLGDMYKSEFKLVNTH
jgi:hypothetical protein